MKTKSLEELKTMLCEELEKIGKKGELKAGDLDVIDKLAHATKNLDKIIMSEGVGEYSEGGGMWNARGSYAGGGNRGGNSSRTGGTYGDESYDDYSMRRGRDRMGRYTSRDSSRDMMISKLEELMYSADDEHDKREVKKLIEKLKNA